MEKATALLTRVRWALRLRRALLALGVSAFLSLAVIHLRRYFGLALPSLVFWAPFMFPILVLAFPVRAERLWFWAGRRLGIGGRLAGLSAALRRKNTVFLSALLEHLSLPLARLFFPEALVLVPTLILCGLLFLPPSPPLSTSQKPPVQSESVEESFTSPLAPPSQDTQQKTIPPEIPRLPSGFSDFSSYPLILAALFGEELTLEEAVQKFSEEEGLLRRLADLLTQAQGEGSPAGVSPEVGELIENLSRPDLREALSQALAQGSEKLEEAQALVAAALEGVSRTRNEILSTLPENQESKGVSEGAVGSEGGEGSAVGVLPDTMMLEEAPVLPREELAEVQEGLGLGAGWEQGEPLQPGLPQESPMPTDVLAADTRMGEGPVRTGVALSLPGEAPIQDLSGEVQISPQEVEVLIREASLPPALRELVRRYFELLGGGS